MNIPFLDKNKIAKLLDYPTLIRRLDEAFRADTMVIPPRHHHDYQGTASGLSSTLLLMPGWKEGGKLGIKIVTVSPDNYQRQLPAIHGIYVLFDAVTGIPQMLLDAKELTVRRTAAASALASKYLSKENSETLLMIGTGTLAPHLILAHASVRPIKKVIIWGRNQMKARSLAEDISQERFEVTAASNLTDSLSKADIISSATLSSKPLVLGEKIIEGQHIDLVGSYKKDMREADNEAISKSMIYVDTKAAMEESGDLLIPLQEEVITPSDIMADLFQLCKNRTLARKSATDITLFKSVGYALEDLVAAQQIWETYEEG